jgi:hypothetical protein
MLMLCPALHGARLRYLPEIRELVTANLGYNKWMEICTDEDKMLQLLVDCSSRSLHIGDWRVRAQIETSSRCLCHVVHCTRSSLLSAQLLGNTP